MGPAVDMTRLGYAKTALNCFWVSLASAAWWASCGVIQANIGRSAPRQARASCDAPGISTSGPSAW